MDKNKYYSTHEWLNGAVITSERVDDANINIRIQDANENMVVDVVLGEYESVCLAHSILSVITHKHIEVRNG